MGIYNSDPDVYTLAEAIEGDADLTGKVWDRMLEVGANTADDFTRMEGSSKSMKVIWKRTELQAAGGDEIIFSTMGDLAGPGVQGEQELTGKTSKPRLGTYKCRVDFWRDGFEYSKKKMFLAAGESLESTALDMLSKKLGRRKMFDMMMSLIRKANGNIIRPNNKRSRDELRAEDVLTTSFINQCTARLKGQGGRPVNMTKSASGSPVHHYLAFICSDAMTDIRNSTSYQNALDAVAAADGTDSGMFTGELVDWQGIYLWEHVVVDPDADDVIGSPLAPKGILGVAVIPGTGQLTVHFGDDDPNNLYSSFFPGYDWQWVENQIAAPDSTDHFFWIVNGPDAGTDPGKAGFYRYIGTGNTGVTIQTKNEAGNGSTGAGGRLGASVSSTASTKIGQVAWNASTMTETHEVGAYVIPANQWGVPCGYSFIFGAGACLRAYGAINAQLIRQERDFGFIKGVGYESVYGQTPTFDTRGRTRHYVLCEHAIEFPGIVVPYVTS